jgi:hypothetical protein
MMMVEQSRPSAVLIARRTLAFPVYIVALVLDLASYFLACVGAWIAGDDWPVR